MQLPIQSAPEYSAVLPLSNIEVRFSDVFPISLTGLQYNVNATDIQYLEATVEFGYKIYEFATKGASRTTTTIT